MDINSIKQIVELMKDAELSEFELENDGLKLRIARDNGKSVSYIQSPSAQALPVAAPAAPQNASAPQKEKAESDPNIKIIPSPMVGTFYGAASPDSPKYVSVGTKVTPDSVVCIIEAMKVMNEIQAEISGEIVEILVQNEQALEYGQPLFKVKIA